MGAMASNVLTTSAVAEDSPGVVEDEADRPQCSRDLGADEELARKLVAELQLETAYEHGDVSSSDGTSNAFSANAADDDWCRPLPRVGATPASFGGAGGVLAHDGAAHGQP